MGRDVDPKAYAEELAQFQSTRPVWGATATFAELYAKWTFQSTRPVWGATFDLREDFARIQFQSTRPVWGAT